MSKRVAELRAQHKKIKSDWHCGPFIIRGSNNLSPLDRWIPKDTNDNIPKYPNAKFASGWKVLNRFYELCKCPPMVANLQKGVKYITDTFWVFVYPCSYYITITKSQLGIEGEHVVILWYRSSFKKNFAVASANWEGRFVTSNKDLIIQHIKHLRLTKDFFQSHASQTELIPL